VTEDFSEYNEVLTISDVASTQTASNEDCVKKMEMQLHQQFAENNNANLGSVVALIGASVAVLGAYAYVYVYSTFKISDWGNLVASDDTFSLNVLVFAAIASFVVLTILQYICVYQGIHQRKEQFVIYAIRCKYYGMKPEKVTPRIYPSNYTPFKNSSCSLKLIQGLFGELVKIFFLLELIILVATILKMMNASHSQEGWSSCLFMLIIAFILCIIIVVWSIRRFSQNYEDIRSQYENENS